MSASSLPLPFLVPRSPAMPNRELPPPSRTHKASLQVVRRRPNMQQGRSLEILGHAIEYLIDSRMFLINDVHVPTEAGAVQLLSRCSREVFATCPEIVPVSARLKQWASDRLRIKPLGPIGGPSPRRA